MTLALGATENRSDSRKKNRSPMKIGPGSSVDVKTARIRPEEIDAREQA